MNTFQPKLIKSKYIVGEMNFDILTQSVIIAQYFKKQNNACRHCPVVKYRQQMPLVNFTHQSQRYKFSESDYTSAFTRFHQRFANVGVSS